MYIYRSIYPNYGCMCTHNRSLFPQYESSTMSLVICSHPGLLSLGLHAVWSASPTAEPVGRISLVVWQPSYIYMYIYIYMCVCVEVPCTKNQNWLMFYEQILGLSWNNYETLSKDICFQPARMGIVWTNMDANQGWPLTWEMRNERTAYPRGFKDFGQVNGWKTGTALISHKFNEWWMFIPAHVTYCQKVWETFVIVSVLIGPFVCNGWGYIDLPSYQIIQFIIEMCYYSTFW